MVCEWFGCETLGDVIIIKKKILLVPALVVVCLT